MFDDDLCKSINIPATTKSAEKVHDYIRKLSEVNTMTYLTKLQEAAQRPSEPRTGYVPLTEQIQALTSSLSPLQLNRPWAIDELLPMLQGRYQKRPATREVAKALTQLGWQRKRCWKKSGLNRRFWQPPEER